MEISLDQVAQLTPSMARSLIPQWLASFVETDPVSRDQMVEQVGILMEEASDAEVAGAINHLVEIGSDYTLYPANPLARAVSRTYMSSLAQGSSIEGLEHLRAAMEMGPCLLLSNHLAYCDTQIKDLLLSWAGADDVAEAIVAVAGPKVYGTVFRRMASSGLSTMKTAQSTAVSHNEAALSPREVGRIAIETVRRAGDLMLSGQPVLIYAEGSRSRDGRLQPFLKAVRKYAAVPGLRVVPLAISGTNRMMPLHQTQMFAGPVCLRIGESVPADPTDRAAVVVEVWSRIADLLPEENRPLEATSPTV
jgi:1-acyl-sn-glycerol-3-phosphate acyltransferase